MRVTLLTVAVLTIVGCVVASSSQCDREYECAYEYTDGSKSFKYDFSSLCRAKDYVLTDNAQHTYYAHICGVAKQNCLPSTCIRACFICLGASPFGIGLTCWLRDSKLGEHVRIWCHHPDVGCHTPVQVTA